MVGKLDDQNTVFGDQAHQSNQTDLAEHIECAARQFERHQGPGHRQRYAEQDNQGVNKTLELRGKHQKYKQQCQGKHQGQGIRRLAKFTTAAIEVGGIAGLEHFFGRGVHKVQRLAHGIVGRQVGGDGGGTALAKVVELTRHHHFANLDQGRQWDHGIATPTHIYFFDIVRRIPATGRGLNDHVVLLAFALVACDLAPTEHGFHGPGDQVNPDAHVCSPLAVDFELDLGLVQAQIGIHLHKTRIFRQLILKSPHRLGQVLVTVRRDDHKIDRPLDESLAQGGRRDWKCGDARQARHPGRHFTGHLQRGSAALFPGLGTKKYIPLSHSRVANSGKNPVEFRKTLADPLDDLGVTVGVFKG